MPRSACSWPKRVNPTYTSRKISGDQGSPMTSRVRAIVALAVSVDGYITGRDPGAGRGLGDGTMLFDWYLDGDTASQVFGGFRLSEPSARVFDAIAGRVGASLAGRNTYHDSGWIN